MTCALSFLGFSEKREGLTCGLVIMCRMCASRCRGLRCCASHGRSVHHTRAGCQGFGAFNTALTSLRKKRKELGDGFSEVTVEWVDMCGQKVTERFGEEHHAKKKKTVGACIISPGPNNRPATTIDIIKTASFGACHKLACDLGGKDAVYELCRAWMKDANIKSNFAQSLVWHSRRAPLPKSCLTRLPPTRPSSSRQRRPCKSCSLQATTTRRKRLVQAASEFV